MQCAKKRGPASRANAGNRTWNIPTPSNTTGRVFPYHKKERGPLDFDSINRMALAAFPAVLARILPRGKIIGREYMALNPTRADHRPGSFKIRLSLARRRMVGLRDRRSGRRPRVAPRLSRELLAN